MDKETIINFSFLTKQILKYYPHINLLKIRDNDHFVYYHKQDTKRYNLKMIIKKNYPVQKTLHNLYKY